MKNWKIEEMTGYKPITTFYMDFSIAEQYGIQAIKDTYTRAFDEWQKDYKYITELVMVLNWKIYEHYKTNKKLAEVYNDLWEELDSWVCENFNEEELSYYLRITD